MKERNHLWEKRIDSQLELMEETKKDMIFFTKKTSDIVKIKEGISRRLYALIL